MDIPEPRILPVHKGGNQPECKFVQGKPNCCPFKDFKCPRTGKAKEIVFIADIPLEERHKYLDPEQDIKHPCMKVMGHPKNKLQTPLEEQVEGLHVSVNAILQHLQQLTTALNKLSK